MVFMDLNGVLVYILNIYYIQGKGGFKKFLKSKQVNNFEFLVVLVNLSFKEMNLVNNVEIGCKFGLG